MNRRRMMRKQRKLICFASIVFVVFVIYIALFTEDHAIIEKHFNPFSEKCLSTVANDLVQEVCVNVSKGIAFGSFCKELCDGKSVSVDSCIHHDTTYVLLGKHDEKREDIVIKKKKPHNLGLTFELFEESIKYEHNMERIRESYVQRLFDDIKSIFGEQSALFFKRNTDNFLLRLLGKRLSDLTLRQMRNSWYLLGQDEVFMMALHQDLHSIPRLKGTCGTVYVMEGSKPLSKLFSGIQGSKNWSLRAKVALSFLKLLRNFERSVVGRLNHCDIQPENFGFTEQLQVKAIDTDLVFSQDRMDEILPQPKCTKDEECDFFDCLSKCDVTKQKCTAESITNNLMVVCRDIFFPDWPMLGLLSSFQPSHVKKQLTMLLNDCKSKAFGLYAMNHHNVQSVMKNLDDLLTRSLLTGS